MKDIDDINPLRVLIFVCFMGFMVLGTILTNSNSISAVQGNVTMSAYNAYNVATFSPIILVFVGISFWFLVGYTLLYKRDLLGKVLLGYFVLVCLTLLIGLIYVLIMSLPALVGLAKDIVIGFVNFLYGFFYVSGDVVVNVPAWVYGVLILTLPIAYLVGDFVQKWNQASEASNKDSMKTRNEN